MQPGCTGRVAARARGERRRGEGSRIEAGPLAQWPSRSALARTAHRAGPEDRWPEERCGAHTEREGDRDHDTHTRVGAAGLQVLDRPWLKIYQFSEALLGQATVEANPPDVRGDRRQRLLDDAVGHAPT